MKRHSFFSVLFALFLLIGLLVIGLCVLSVQVSLNDGFREYLNRSAWESIDRVDGAFTRLIRELQAEADTLAQSEEVRAYLDQSGAAESMLMRTIYRIANTYDNGVDVCVVSASEPIGLSNIKLPQAYMYPYNTIDWGVFRHINAGDETPTAGLDPTSGVVLILGKPVRDGERTAGYVLLAARRKLLDERLSVSGGTHARRLAIADRYGDVLYSSEGRAGEGLGALSAAGIVSVETGEESDSEPDVIRQVNAHTGLLLYFQESRELLDIVRSQLGSAIRVTAVIVLLVVIVAAWALSSRLRRPFVALEDVVGRIEGGDFTIHAPETGFAEIASLGRSINHMASELDRMVHNIEEKQHMLRVAQINALQLQVNPHFLYNTLDLIRWLAREQKVDEAAATVVSLAKLLRRTLDLKSDIVTVETEMELVRDYISIQCMRYEDRLTCSMDIPEALLGMKMPKLLLLPIIENSVIHGLQDKPEAGHVNVWAARDGDYLVFHVDDDGIGMSPQTLLKVSAMRQDGMYGIGLANVDKRAKLFGDERCGVKIDSQLQRGTRIVLTVKRIPEERED